MASRLESATALRSQRRFLIVISMVVAAYYALAVHLKGEGEYSGIAVTIERPDRIPAALWIIFAWALLRYTQRLHEQWRFVGRAIMKEVERCDHQLVLEAARRSAAMQILTRQLGKDLEKPYLVGDVQVTETVKEMMRETMAQRAQAQGKPPPPAEPDPWFTIDENGNRIYRDFAIGVASADQPQAIGHEFKMPPWSRTQFLWHQLRSWVRASVRFPAILEYIAPLLIALVAVLVAFLFIAVRAFESYVP
jgi:hypothetical protein